MLYGGVSVGVPLYNVCPLRLTCARRDENTMSEKLIALKNAVKYLSAIALLASSTVHAELEEVVVTATKRAEGLQDVPLSVSAMSSEMMNAAGITDMAELSAYIPNFEVSDASIGRRLPTVRI